MVRKMPRIILSTVVSIMVLPGIYFAYKKKPTRLHLWLRHYPPYKQLFNSFFTATSVDARWGLVQISLSFSLFFFGTLLAILTIDLPNGGKLMSTASWILFGTAIFVFIYAISLGIYYYNNPVDRDKHTDIGVINKDIRDKMKQLKEARDEQIDKSKQR